MFEGFGFGLVTIAIDQHLGGAPDVDIIGQRDIEPLNYGGRAMFGRGRNIGIWVVIGIAAGAFVGVSSGGIGGWIVGGALVGAVVGAVIPKRRS